jgi:hypothetical protein
MQPERDDSSNDRLAEDADPAILVGALGDERVGLDLERDTQQADDAAEEGALSAPPATLRAHLSSRREPGCGQSPDTFAVPSGIQDADPAILVGALGDERVGLDTQRDAAEPNADPG